MKKSPDELAVAVADLRRLAEARLMENAIATGRCLKEADQRRLHELEVHQIELELQNEELKRARAELETVLTRYTTLYDFAPTGYFTLDRKGAILGLNLAGASLLGMNRSALVKRRFGLFVAAASRPAFADCLAKTFESGTKEVCEVPLPQNGNPPCWIRIEACGTVAGQECRLTVMDITERKQAEWNRARLERQVHAASDREQRRIGESLHEDICQRLVGIELAASAMANTLKTQVRPESELAGEIAGDLRECLHRARRLANMLQPVSLLEQGLVAALDALALDVQERSGIRCHFKGEDLPSIAAADATHLYRIVQEALKNAVQHAKANRIDVGLTHGKGGLTLTVADNGSGMAKPSESGSGLGLHLMRYRSDLLGAALTVASKRGGGTVVTCCYRVARTHDEACDVTGKVNGARTVPLLRPSGSRPLPASARLHGIDARAPYATGRSSA